MVDTMKAHRTMGAFGFSRHGSQRWIAKHSQTPL